MFESIALTLRGRLVALEPLREEHGPGLRTAAQDMDWSFMPVDPQADDDLFDRWLEDALEPRGVRRARAVRGAGRGHGQPLGSTRYLSLRPEHRGLEIGWTWLTRSAWSTGANVEAKLLLLEHAFERLGCMRVEFKTDAKNERSPPRARRAARAVRRRVPQAHARRERRHTPPRLAWYAIVDDDWPAVKANLEAAAQTLKRMCSTSPSSTA